jgi:enamine deaminase RidA (YjgF/YER057c/UK114 family)
MAGRIEARLHELGITLPTPVAPIANYVLFSRLGSLVITSGQLPVEDGKLVVSGKLGAEVSVEQGQLAARICFINQMALLRVACDGDLDRVVKVLKLTGFLAVGPEFSQHAAILNGASDLAVAVFGDAGRHARSTVGVASLPMNAAVEVEGLFEIA